MELLFVGERAALEELLVVVAVVAEEGITDTLATLDSVAEEAITNVVDVAVIKTYILDFVSGIEAGITDVVDMVLAILDSDAVQNIAKFNKVIVLFSMKN